MSYQKIVEYLGNEADHLLNHESKTICKELLHTPSPDFVDKIFSQSNRDIPVLRSLAT
jgi:fructose-bisphosphate aldolase, class I